MALALSSGTRLGVYEVTAQIGEGGMGQVYRATDTKLKRGVAIKVLPASVADDADRLAPVRELRRLAGRQTVPDDSARSRFRTAPAERDSQLVRQLRSARAGRSLRRAGSVK